MRIVKTEQEGHALSQVKGGIAFGYKRNSAIKDPLDFLDGITELDYNNESIYDIMRVSDKLYKLDGICGRSIDVMNDFATTPLRMEPTKNKKFNQIVDIFFENINVGSGSDPGIYHLMQRLSLEYLIYGNCVPMQSWQKIDIPTLGEIVFPTRILQLDPLRVYPEESNSQFGPKQLLYRLDDSTIKSMKNDGRTDKNKKNIPAMIKRRYRASLKDSSLKYKYHIKLDPRITTHIKRKARDYENWGVPYLSKVFKAASVVHKLQRLDECTLDGLINLITIFKIGSDKFPANSSRIAAFLALLRQNGTSTDPNRYLVWSHDVDILQVGPDNKILSYEDRYQSAIRLLKNSIGISDILLGEKVVGNPWAAFLAMLESLVAMRKSLSVWLLDILFSIADQNNIKLEETPQITWERMNLTNDSEMKNLILAFWDRGLLDARSAIGESGRKYNTVLQNKKELKKSGDDLLFVPPKLPFSNNPTDGDGAPKEEDVKKKDPKPDTFKSTAHDIMENVYKDTINHYLQGISDSVSLGKNAEDNILGLYYELNQALNSLNDVNHHYGIMTRVRHILDESQNRVVSSLPAGIEDCCDVLENEKDIVYSELYKIRKANSI